MMAKEFKTVNELVALLESRGVKTDENTKKAIERESYYAIVNGYKTPFQDRKAMQSSSGDVFVSGTDFNSIYELFLFDRELRSLTFKYLARAEAAMRTAVAYVFSEKHTEDGAYVIRSNFCSWHDYLVQQTFKGDKRSLHSTNLASLMKTLNDKLVVSKRSREFVRHYMNTYGKVPLWVLVNDLTFGNIVHFYQLMKPDERIEVCNVIARQSGRDSKKRGTLSPRKLLRTGKVLVGFRNICAHDERLYCAKVENASIGEMTSLMINILPENEVDEYVKEALRLWYSHSQRIKGVSLKDIFTEMGFTVSVSGSR